MKLSELEAAHEEEHAQEEAKRTQENFKRKRRNAKRKLDLAALEFKLWDSDLCDNEFPKTNTSEVSAESQHPVILKERTVSNIVSTVSIQTTASITATKRGASSHMLKGEQPIPPGCLSSADGTSFSASPNADLGVNFYAPPPVVTTFSTLPMQNALKQRDYSTNSSFPREPFSSAPNPSFHQQSVWSWAPGGLVGGVAFFGATTTDRELTDREQRRLAEKGDPKYIFTIPRAILPKPSLCDEITATKSVTKSM